MMKASHVLALAAVGNLLMHTEIAPAQNLVATTAPAQNWVSLASSADGSKLAAVASYGWIYLSTNSGATWTDSRTITNAAEPQRPWTGIASSSDGGRLVAVANFSPIFCSSNSGQTWSTNGPIGVWAAVASSSDGMTLVAVDHQMGLIYLSRDGGATWNVTSAPNRRWRSIAACGNGSTMLAGTDYGTNYNELPSIFVSTDSGTTWKLSSVPAYPWQTLTVSADGTRLAAGAYGGPICVSHDSGATWTTADVPSLRWGGIASSADGSRLAAAAWEGSIYVSGDYGRSWTKADAPQFSWQTIASSADGLRIIAGIWNLSSGGIYAADFPPALSIGVSAQGTILSWPAPATGYVLEEKPDFTSPSWQPVSVLPVVVDGRNQVRIQSSNMVGSYRLRRAEVVQKADLYITQVRSAEAPAAATTSMK